MALATVRQPLSPAALKPGFLYTEAPRYDAAAWLRGGERFPEGATVRVVSGGVTRALAPGFFATADPDLAFDSKTVLFAGKQRREDPWQLWEAPVAGGVQPKRIAKLHGDTIRPLHLPRNRIAYARKHDEAFHLELLGFDGEPLPLGFVPGSVLPRQLLADGRILFEAAFPLGGGEADAPAELYTVHTDGSGVEALRCDHGKEHREAHQLASGEIVFTAGGKLAKFTPALARQVAVPSPEGDAEPPVEIEPGRWLLPLRPRVDRPFGLFEWQPGKPAGPAAWVSGDKNAVQPVLVRPRQTPPWHPSGLHDRPGANLLCLNAYEPPLGIEPGAIAAVRVYAQNGAQHPVVLGQTPVESDGSFFVQLPTEQPIRLELLDKAGHVLAGEKGWFWMRRGEQRICVGCHAGPERAPDNAEPKILSKPGGPVPMGRERIK